MLMLCQAPLAVAEKQELQAPAGGAQNVRARRAPMATTRALASLWQVVAAAPVHMYSGSLIAVDAERNQVIANPFAHAVALTGRKTVMHKNEGVVDRVIRIAVGLGLLSMTVVGPQALWGLVGLVPLLTGVLGFCPAYRLLGISTCAPVRPAGQT